MNLNGYEDNAFNMYIQIELINVKRNIKVCYDDLKKFKIYSDNTIWLKFTDGFITIYKFTAIEYEFNEGFSYYPHIIKVYSDEV